MVKTFSMDASAATLVLDRNSHVSETHPVQA